MLELDARDLEKALAVASEVIPTRTTLDVYKKVLVRCAGNKTLFISSDGEIGATTAVKSEGSISELLVDAARLRTVCHGVDKILMKKVNDGVEVRAGKSYFKIPTFDAMLYPEKQVKEPECFTIPAADLKIGMGVVSPFIDSVEVKTSGGGKIIAKDGVVEMYSMMNSGMGYFRYATPTKTHGEIIMSRRAMKAIRTLGVGDMTFGVTEFSQDRSSLGAEMWVRFGETRIWALGVVGVYHRHEAFIKAIDETQFVEVNANELRNCLKHAGLVTDIETQKVRLSLRDSTLGVRASSRDQGEFISDVPVIGEGNWDVDVSNATLHAAVSAFEMVKIGKWMHNIALKDDHCKAIVMGMKDVMQ